MFNIKSIVHKITDRGRDSQSNSPGRGNDDDSFDKQGAEGFLCPKCMIGFPSPEELQSHYKVSHEICVVCKSEETNCSRCTTAVDHVNPRTGECIKPNLEKETVYVTDVPGITDVAELQNLLMTVIHEKSKERSLKDHVEMKAARLTRENVSLKAAVDEGESNRIALNERLKVVEAQLAHRESIDDAAVLRQEMVQVQRVMDELTREKERERDVLQVELDQLRNTLEDRHKLRVMTLQEEVKGKDEECSMLLAQLDTVNTHLAQLQEKLKNEGLVFDELQASIKNQLETTGDLENYKMKIISLEAEYSTVREERDHLRTVVLEANLKEKAQIQYKEKVVSLSKQLEDNKLQISDLSHELLFYTDKVGELTAHLDTINSDMASRTQQYEDLKRASVLLENELEAKRDMVSRLEMERNELLGEIEAGQGITTAIHQLTRENQSLKLEMQEQKCSFAEQSEDKDLMIGKLEGSVKESLAKVKAVIAENDKKEEEITALKEISTQKENVATDLLKRCEHYLEENHVLMKNCKELNTKVEGKNEEIETLNKVHLELTTSCSISEDEVKHLSTIITELEGVVQQHKSKTATLQKEYDNATAKIDQLELQQIDLMNVFKEKEDGFHAGENELQRQKQTMVDKVKDLEEQLQTVSVQRASLETTVFKMSQASAKLEMEKKNMEAHHASDSEQLMKITEELKCGKVLLLKEISNLEKECSLLQTKFGDSQEDAKKNLKEVEKLHERDVENEKILAEERRISSFLKKEISEIKKVNEESMIIKCDELKLKQAAFDEATGEKLALEAQLEASQCEQRALLERCYANTTESENHRRTISELRRKLEESQAAVHELGRENQTLQLELEKLVGRKWAEDADVASCTVCHKEFTLIVRKHHCRNCGQIFCNECSSKMAPVATNKKPVRVCEPCYNELVHN